jgi:hypothetical protein
MVLLSRGEVILLSRGEVIILLRIVGCSVLVFSEKTSHQCLSLRRQMKPPPYSLV